MERMHVARSWPVYPTLKLIAFKVKLVFVQSVFAKNSFQCVENAPNFEAVDEP